MTDMNDIKLNGDYIRMLLVFNVLFAVYDIQIANNFKYKGILYSAAKVPGMKGILYEPWDSDNNEFVYGSGLGDTTVDPISFKLSDIDPSLSFMDNIEKLSNTNKIVTDEGVEN